MKPERTIDRAAPAGRAVQIAAVVMTGVVVVSWVSRGTLYLLHDPGKRANANQQLGYPLYLIPLLGVTHIVPLPVMDAWSSTAPELEVWVMPP